MPELPEVETVRRGLEQHVVGKEITKVTVLLEKMLIGDSQDIIDKQIISIGRRGKLLIVGIEGGGVVLIHLRMTGQLLLKSKIGNRVLPDKHTRVVLELEDEVLYFQDQRTFGYFELINNAKLKTNKFLNALGVEPFSELFTFELFGSQLKKKLKTPVKTFLLDQTIIAGIGNIYADEACFRAGILPWRKCGELEEAEIEKLYVAIKEVLSLSVDLGGASAANYVDVTGGKGDFMRVANVYRQQGKPCRVCGSPIQKTKFGGRGTHFCIQCQK